MKSRKLGNSDVLVTPMAFGAWAIGGWMWGGADESDALKAVRAAYESGITSIDTAPIYGFGKSEELVGKAMQGVPRDRYQLLTKFGMTWQHEQGDFSFETTGNDGKPLKIYKWSSPNRVIEECEDSLRRLKTDYIDLYQIHWPDITTPIHETFEAVGKLMKQGKIRAAGVCNYNPAQVNEAMEVVALASNQVPYSMINREIEKDIIPQAIERNIGIIPYSPLQRGLLTGKIRFGHQFNQGDTREGNRFYTEENIRRVNALLDKLRPIAEKHGASLAQLVINWTINRRGIACTLVGARNVEQVNDNVRAFSFNLSQQELDEITAIADTFTLAKPEVV